MEYVVLLVLGLIAAVFGLKSKADKAETEKKLAETKAKDQALVEQEKEVAAAIETLDAGIEKMKAEREAEAKKRAEDNMSLKERADRIKKGLN